MIKEFWESQKEERKQKKLLKKQQKKQLTKEEKVRRITGYIVTVLIIVCMFSTTCSANKEDVDWSGALGITEEYIVEMEKPVDENLMFPNGKINSEDWESFAIKMQSAGMTIFNEEYEIVEDLLETGSLVGDLVLSGRDVGAVCKICNDEMGVNTIASVCDFELYQENNKTYEKTIVYLDLNKFIKDSDLPSVYLTTVSEIKVLKGSITAMNYNITINQLSEELSAEILEVLNKLTYDRITRIANDTLNRYVNSFFSILQIDIEIVDQGLNLSQTL